MSWHVSGLHFLLPWPHYFTGKYSVAQEYLLKTVYFSELIFQHLQKHLLFMFPYIFAQKKILKKMVYWGMVMYFCGRVPV